MKSFLRLTKVACSYNKLRPLDAHGAKKDTTGNIASSAREMYRTKLLVFYYIDANKQNTPMHVIIMNEKKVLDTYLVSQK